MSVVHRRANNVFHPTKVHHLVYHVVKALGRELGAIELMKIVFLIDVEHWRFFGRTLSGVQYVRETKGPFSREIASATASMVGHEIKRRLCLSSGFSRFLKKAHSLGQRPRFRPELPRDGAEVLRQALMWIRNLSPFELEERAYDAKPMQAILQAEARTRMSYRGKPIDFTVLERDAFMSRWLTNRAIAAEAPSDVEYEREAQKERREFEELLG